MGWGFGILGSRVFELRNPQDLKGKKTTRFYRLGFRVSGVAGTASIFSPYFLGFRGCGSESRGVRGVVFDLGSGFVDLSFTLYG